MTIKDFKVGQIACVVKDKNLDIGSVQEYTVTNVGRKLITVEHQGLERVFDAKKGFMEANWYRGDKLYASRELVLEAMEKQNLETWFRKMFKDFGNSSTFSTKTLQQAKKILETDLINSNITTQKRSRL